MEQTKPVNKAAVRYGLRLRAVLAETNTTIYRLSRKINPQAPESARSSIQRYLRGAVLPSLDKRNELADALGRDELRSVPDPDDEEEDPVAALMQSLRRVVQAEMARGLA
jgi:transcriptional regulator with XRE-family HTH domain